MSISGMKAGWRAGAALGAFFVAATLAPPTQAQIFNWTWGGEPAAPSRAPTLSQSLAARGYRVLAQQRSGGVYVVDVMERGGERRRMIVDAYSGAILQVFAYASAREPEAIRHSASLPIERPYRPQQETAPIPPEDIGSSAPPTFKKSPTTHTARSERDKTHTARVERDKTHAARVERHERRRYASREEQAPEDKPSAVVHDLALPVGPAAEVRPAAPGPAARKRLSKAPAIVATPSDEPASIAPRQTASVKATIDIRPSAPAPAPVAPPHPPVAAAAAPTANRPGYANGVPINPLD